jgi:EAL domain-containing protein (putative c-di-GMP-specific phosphodiesterase class I)
MGIRLSMDDFGTGYSSLAYLRQLPITELKIDRSFVCHVTTNDNDAIIVRSTIEMARNLGLETVAEGVETAEALEYLEFLGCDYAQGYYLSRPVPEEELRARLQELRHSWYGSPPSVEVRF